MHTHTHGALLKSHCITHFSIPIQTPLLYLWAVAAAGAEAALYHTRSRELVSQDAAAVFFYRISRAVGFFSSALTRAISIAYNARVCVVPARPLIVRRAEPSVHRDKAYRAFFPRIYKDFKPRVFLMVPPEIYAAGGMLLVVYGFFGESRCGDGECTVQDVSLGGVN